MRVPRDDEDVVIVPRRSDGSLMTVFEALNHPANVSRRDRQEAHTREVTRRLLSTEVPGGDVVIFGLAPEEGGQPG